MAVTVKKTKAPAKPKPTATKKNTMHEVAKIAAPSREAIEQLARTYWAERGWQDGYAEQDWLRAEQSLMQQALMQQAS